MAGGIELKVALYHRRLEEGLLNSSCLEAALGVKL